MRLKFLLALALASSMVIGCGDDDAPTKEASDNNTTVNNTATNNTATNNTSANNTSANNTTLNNTSANNSSDFTTTIPGDTQLKDLTPAEQTQLCGEFDDFMSDTGADVQVCTFIAVFAAGYGQPADDAALQSACQAALTDCMAEPNTCDPVADDCTATVAESSACTNDAMDAFVAADLPDCATITLAELDAFGAQSETLLEEPASCATMEMKCPDPE